MTKAFAIALLKQDIQNSKQKISYYHNEVGIEALDLAIKALEQQRKRGKWIFREDMGHQYCCSECGCPKPFVNDYYYKKVIGCPYCLADMRGDNDEI